MINRTCSLSGVWESVDPSLCTPFTFINVVSVNVEDIILSNILMLKVMYMVNLHMQANITLNNYEEVLTNVSGAVRGAATSEMEQTTGNLTVVAAAFARSAAQLVGETAIIPSTVSSLQFAETA